jgi:hypothetical protein
MLHEQRLVGTQTLAQGADLHREAQRHGDELRHVDGRKRLILPRGRSVDRT